MAFFGPSPSAADIGTAVQAATGSNATAADIGAQVLASIGANPDTLAIQGAFLNALQSNATRLKPLVRYLDEAGDGTGNFSANVDGSSTPVEFFIQPPASTIFNIGEFSVFIQDAAIINSEDYGGLAALTTGIDVEIVLNSTVFSLNGQKKIQGHSEWGLHLNTIDFLDFDTTGSNEKVIVARSNSQLGIKLDGDNNDKLIIRINDNLAGLSEQFFLVQGSEE